MDNSVVWLAAGVGLLAVIGCGVAVFSLRRAAAFGGVATGLAEKVDGLTAIHHQLAGQISQLAAVAGGQQAEIGRNLTERLDTMTLRLNERLERNAEQTGKALGDLQTRLAMIDAAQQTIADLSTQVTGLQDILANKQARGAFGEVQLADIVQNALPPTAYDFQQTLGNGSRCDCLIRMPNPPGAIVVDAKFPLEGYHRLRAAENDADRRGADRGFRQDVATHIRDIAGKYILPGETADSALMFLPSEAIYAELHANFPDVVELSYRARVWIVSPTTLMATLNTVRAVLKDARMRAQADVIQKQVHLLADDIKRLDQRVGQLRNHFDRADKDIRDIQISTDKILRRGDRIADVHLEDQPPDSGTAGPRLAETGSD